MHKDHKVRAGHEGETDGGSIKHVEVSGKTYCLAREKRAKEMVRERQRKRKRGVRTTHTHTHKRYSF